MTGSMPVCRQTSDRDHRGAVALGQLSPSCAFMSQFGAADGQRLERCLRQHVAQQQLQVEQRKEPFHARWMYEGIQAQQHRSGVEAEPAGRRRYSGVTMSSADAATRNPEATITKVAPEVSKASTPATANCSGDQSTDSDRHQIANATVRPAAPATCIHCSAGVAPGPMNRSQAPAGPPRGGGGVQAIGAGPSDIAERPLVGPFGHMTKSRVAGGARRSPHPAVVVPAGVRHARRARAPARPGDDG